MGTRSRTVIDLFSGVGGISQGFIKARGLDGEPLYDVRLLVDEDREAAATFKNNYPNIPFLVKDVRLATAMEVRQLAGSAAIDVVVGGPPCQGFSSVGKREADDKRNDLVHDFVRLVSELQPKVVLMENVPNVLGSAHESRLEQILQTLSEAGYAADARVLHAADYGVPQIRRRAFVFALRKGIPFPEAPFPPTTCDPSKYVTAEEAIGDLPSIVAGEGEHAVPHKISPASEYQKARRRTAFLLFNHISRKHAPDFLKRIALIPEGAGNRDLDPETMFSDSYYSQAYARLSRNEPAYTITAHFMNPGSGRYIHYRDGRSITVREAARLQGFDDNFVFHGTASAQARHVGNAVPPLMARAWAEHIAKILSTTSRRTAADTARRAVRG